MAKAKGEVLGEDIGQEQGWAESSEEESRMLGILRLEKLELQFMRDLGQGKNLKAGKL